MRDSRKPVLLRAIHSDAIITGDAAPVEDGVAIVSETGLVVEVGRASDLLPRHAGVPVERVVGVVFPGLVNAHTHLELSALRSEVPGGAGFVPWVEKLIGMRVETSPEDDADAIQRAVDELDAFGTCAVGEVTNSLAALKALARSGIVGSVFHEVFGVKRESVMNRVRGLAVEVEERIGRWSAPGLSYAAAPHTLYTTHPDAVRAIMEAAAAGGRRTTLHLAEHAAERAALEEGSGPIPAWIESRVKIPRAMQTWPHESPIAFAARLGALAPHVLLVHLTDARPDELARVAASGAHVVLCPRSNLHIEVRLPPLLAMRSAGIACALGTDSLASNASLDVLAEARALADRFPSVPPSELVQMATWNGARALGLTDLGRIAAGARPGILAVDGDVRGDPCGFLLRNVRSPRRWVARRA